MGPRQASEKQKKLFVLLSNYCMTKKANKKHDLNKDARLKIWKEFKSSYVLCIFHLLD
jgi:hypothetical protein